MAYCDGCAERDRQLAAAEAEKQAEWRRFLALTKDEQIATVRAKWKGAEDRARAAVAVAEARVAWRDHVCVCPYCPGMIGDCEDGPALAHAADEAEDAYRARKAAR